MVVLGTSEENFKSVWVRNEWSRYLSLIKNGEEKVLIPAYRDMDPYDLPEEFSNLQAQDMSKLGFMQDLIRGIEKILGKEDGIVAETIILNENVSVENLIKRIKMFLEDKDFESASEYCERVFDIDSENAQVYLYKLLLKYGLSKPEELSNCKEDFSVCHYYKKIMQFGDENLKNEVSSYLDNAKNYINNEMPEHIYNNVIEKIKCAKDIEDYQEIVKDLSSIIDYKDAKVLLEKSQEELNNKIYNKAEELINSGSLDDYILARDYLKTILSWKDSNNKYQHCNKQINKIKKINITKSRLKNIYEKLKEFAVNHVYITIIILIIIFLLFSKIIFPFFNYQIAMHYYNSKNYYKAMEHFDEADGFKDSYEKYGICKKIINYNNALKAEKAENYGNAALLYSMADDYSDAKEKFSYCYKKIDKNLQVLSFNEDEFISVNTKGKIVGAKESSGYFLKDSTVNMWENIISVYLSDDYIFAISNDGNLNIKNFDSSSNKYIYPFEIEDWKSIVSVDINKNTIVGVQSNGKANIITENDTFKETVTNWENLLDVKVEDNYIIGLKKDGTVVAGGVDKSIKNDIEGLKNIVKIECSNGIIACLTKSGKVIVIRDENKKFNVSNWKNIEDIALGDVLVGLKSDGTVVQTGGIGISELDKWNDIVDIYTCKNVVIGVKKDGSVIFDGTNYKYMEDVLENETILVNK